MLDWHGAAVVAAAAGKPRPRRVYMRLVGEEANSCIGFYLHSAGATSRSACYKAAAYLRTIVRLCRITQTRKMVKYWWSGVWRYGQSVVGFSHSLEKKKRQEEIRRRHARAVIAIYIFFWTKNQEMLLFFFEIKRRYSCMGCNACAYDTSARVRLCSAAILSWPLRKSSQNFLFSLHFCRHRTIEMEISQMNHNSATRLCRFCYSLLNHSKLIPPMKPQSQ